MNKSKIIKFMSVVFLAIAMTILVLDKNKYVGISCSIIGMCLYGVGEYFKRKEH